MSEETYRKIKYLSNISLVNGKGKFDDKAFEDFIDGLLEVFKDIIEELEKKQYMRGY